MKVIIEKEIESFWGITDLLESLFPDASREEQDAAIITLLQEDVPSLLDGATWTVVRETL